MVEIVLRVVKPSVGTAKIPVEQAGGDGIGGKGTQRAGADPVLSALRVVRGVEDTAGGELRLVDRRHRLGLMGQPGQHPGKLRSIHPGHLRHRDADVALVVQQFAAQSLVEPLDGVLGTAISGLQRNPPIGQRRADLHDGSAVPGPHLLQHRHRAVHVTQVGHLGDPPVLRRLDLAERGEDRGKCRVHLTTTICFFIEVLSRRDDQTRVPCSAHCEADRLPTVPPAVLPV